MSFPDSILSPFSAVSLAGITDATWFTVSSGAPANATGMLYLLATGTGGSVVRETRKTGSSDNYVSDTIQNATQTVRAVGLNGSGQFDYYGQTNASTDLIYPLIFFGSEATFPTNIIIMGSTLTTSYATYSTGGNAPGGLAAIFAIHGSNDYDVYFRHPSSSDTG